jgi:CubicO group peptidase (beta-lactamase class C family)
LPILRALPAGSPAGGSALYCNAGYLVLALVLEATTGEPYAQTIGREVFEACGMAGSAFQPFDQLGPDTAIGYLAPEGEDHDRRTNVDLLPFAGELLGESVEAGFRFGERPRTCSGGGAF